MISIPPSREIDTENITSEPNLRLNDAVPESLVGNTAGLEPGVPATVSENLPLHKRKADVSYSAALKKVRQTVSNSQRNATSG